MSRAENAIRMALAAGGAAGPRRGRDSLGYMEPDPNIPDFAQCGSCASYLSDRVRCYWFSDKFKVLPEASCIVYVQGPPIDGAGTKPIDLIDPKVVGFINGKTRCENCVSYQKGICLLFRVLNLARTEAGNLIFDLEEKVKARGCCNAFLRG
jgi:hypothetical protein